MYCVNLGILLYLSGPLSQAVRLGGPRDLLCGGAEREVVSLKQLVPAGYVLPLPPHTCPIQRQNPVGQNVRVAKTLSHQQ